MSDAQVEMICGTIGVLAALYTMYRLVDKTL